MLQSFFVLGKYMVSDIGPLFNQDTKMLCTGIINNNTIHSPQHRLTTMFFTVFTDLLQVSNPGGISKG